MAGRGPQSRQVGAKRTAHFNETNEYQRRENWREIESASNDIAALAKDAELRMGSTAEHAAKVKAIAEHLQGLAESILANEKGTHKRQRKVPGRSQEAQAESPPSSPISNTTTPSSTPHKKL